MNWLMLLLLQWHVISVINLNMEMKMIPWNIIFNVINKKKDGGGRANSHSYHDFFQAKYSPEKQRL